MELVGGHLLLDLINTVAWRLDDARRADRIADPEALSRWSAAAGLGSPSAPLDDWVELREAAYRVLQPVSVGTEPGRADLAELHRLLDRATAPAELIGVGPLRWQAGDALVTVALAAWQLLDRDLSRLRQCQDDACGWLFLDGTKNGSRRWCSSADCGNRARAKRHYRRLHPVGTT
jgi:predicted RNA-binding Zn ribbon-like protein